MHVVQVTVNISYCIVHQNKNGFLELAQTHKHVPPQKTKSHRMLEVARE